MTCRDCRLLRVLPDADGKVRIRKDRDYLCTAKIESLRLPKSVRDYQPPVPRHIGPDEGEGCSYFQSRHRAAVVDATGLSQAEMKSQGARCGCRGSDDYCVCQNVPDRVTLDGRSES